MREGVVGVWYGNVRSMSAICAAGPASKESAPAQLSVQPQRQAESGRQRARMAWHGMACCTLRVAQLLVFGSCQNAPSTAMCPSDTSQPARSRLWCNATT